MQICFNTQNIYYLPQYLPVANELHNRGHHCEFIIYQDKNDKAQFNDELIALNKNIIWVDNESAAFDYYLKTKPAWIFFGNTFS